jgi:putative flippase GtrA
VPLIYYIKKKDRSENSSDTSNRGTNFYAGMVIQLILLLSLIFILKYNSLGQTSLLIIPILAIASGIVAFYYFSKK